MTYPVLLRFDKGAHLFLVIKKCALQVRQSRAVIDCSFDEEYYMMHLKLTNMVSSRRIYLLSTNNFVQHFENASFLSFFRVATINI